MNVVSTDLMALACIMGSALVGGVVTVAALERGPEPEAACVAEVVHTAPAVVVGTGGAGRTVVVAPRVRMHGGHGCDAVHVDGDRAVHVRIEAVRADVERAVMRSEEARMRMEEALGRDVELRLREEMRRLERELSRLEGGVVR